jgi:hypothetical protein
MCIYIPFLKIVFKIMCLHSSVMLSQLCCKYYTWKKEENTPICVRVNKINNLSLYSTVGDSVRWLSTNLKKGVLYVPRTILKWETLIKISSISFHHIGERDVMLDYLWWLVFFHISEWLLVWAWMVYFLLSSKYNIRESPNTVTNSRI